MKIGDKVIICTTYSCFDNWVGVIEEIVLDDPLPFTVRFEDGDYCYFSGDEVEALEDVDD